MSQPPRLVFLSKRRPSGGDLYQRPFGRFGNLPIELAKKGCKVTVICLSHRRDENDQRQYMGVDWVSISASPNPLAAISRLKKQTCDFEPDWVVGFSDTYYGILATHLAKKIGCQSLVDAYDNYQSYIPWAFPLHWAWRSALKKADLVSAAGLPLLELLNTSRPNKDGVIVPMCADENFFSVDEEAAEQCRKKYKLPDDKALIGYCGSIDRNRDLALLLEVIEAARNLRPDMLFIVTGRNNRQIEFPDNCLHLGFVDADDMPGIVTNLDIMLAVNKSSAFGNHSYPVKLYEAAACGVKTITSHTQATQWMYGDHSQSLIDVGNCSQLLDKLITALGTDSSTFNLQIGRWSRSADILAEAMGLSLLR